MTTKLDLKKLYGIHYDDIINCGKVAFIERQAAKLQGRLDEIRKSLPWYMRILLKMFVWLGE